MVVFQFEAVGDDQPIPDVDDHSETDYDEYERFLDLDFMAQTAIPLSFIYLDVYYDGKIPQGTQ